MRSAPILLLGILFVLCTFAAVFLLFRGGDETAGTVYVGVYAPPLSSVSPITESARIAAVHDRNDEDVDVAQQTFTSGELLLERIEVWHEEEGWLPIIGSEHALVLSESENPHPQYLGRAQLTEGTYTRLRITIQGLMLTDSGGAVVQVPMIHEFLTIDTPVVSHADTDTSLIVRFLLADSLHTAEGGELVFIPVFSLDTKHDAVVSIEDDMLLIESGTDAVSQTFGMHLDGSIGTDGWYKGGAPLFIEHGVVFSRESITPSGRATSSTPAFEEDPFERASQRSGTTSGSLLPQ